MSFRLIYEGELLSANARNKAAVRKNKHAIRKQLHPQLKQLWRTDHSLKFHALLPAKSATGARVTRIQQIAEHYERCGNGFVPLIRTGDHPSIPYVSLHVLFLRREPPGALIKGGTLDNRIKTFFDGLKIPKSCDEITERFLKDEKPMYCLLEDDQAISEANVRTDLLLRPPAATEKHSLNDVMLIVQVRVGAFGEEWHG